MTEEEINEQELDRFEARFFGTMPEAEAVAFDAALETDPAVRERYDLFVLSIRGIQSAGKALDTEKTEALRVQFKAIDRELDARPTVVRPLFQPWMGWAAAVLVLLGGAALWLNGNSDTPQQLADEFAITEPGLPVLMGTSPRTMDAIMNAYKQDDLTTARLLLTSAVEKDPQNDTLQYFNGVLELRGAGCASADAWFARVPTSSVFGAKAQFNMALCALRANDIPRARTLLGGIANGGNAQFAAKSRDLLRRLENM